MKDMGMAVAMPYIFMVNEAGKRYHKLPYDSWLRNLAN